MRVVHRFDDFNARLKLLLVFRQTFFDAFAAADQNRFGDTFLYASGSGTNDADVFPFGEDDFKRVGAGAFNDGLHHEATLVEETSQLVTIGFQVRNRTASDAAFHGCLGNGNRNGGNQAWIERFGDDVILAIHQRLSAVSGHNFFTRRGFGQISNGAHGSHFHRFIDAGRAHIQRPPEKIGETENVIHLIREIGTAGSDNGVIARGVYLFRHDFRHGVGQRQHQRFVCHRLHHLAAEQPCLRDPEEHIRTDQCFCERARFRLGDKFRLAPIQLAGATFINRPLGIADDDVFLLHTEVDEKIQTGHTRCPRAGSNHTHLADVLALQVQGI